MKRSLSLFLSATALCGITLSSYGQVLNDTFADGDRTTQNLPSSSQWFFGGAGSLSVVGPGGPMRGDLGAGGTGSSSWTTYFAPSGSPLTLASPGDMIRLTWQFTLTGVGAQNSSQNFRLALVNTPAAARLVADGAPGSSTYAGYGMIGSMAPVISNANPFQLVERTAPGTASALLSATASWTGLGNGATVGNTGYADGVLYTYTLQLTLNNLGGLDIMMSMAGGSYNNSGLAVLNVTDATPNSLSFDTFSIRPSSATGAAQIFDTSLVRVEYVSVPEPTMFAMAGLGVLGFAFYHRRQRR